MNFELGEDQTMLKALVERFAEDAYDVERRRGYLREDLGFSARNWSLLGELGILSATAPESLGGLELGRIDLAVIHETLGHGLVVEPVLENQVVAGSLLHGEVSETLRDGWAKPVVAGEKRIALAHAEPEARGNRSHIATRATRAGDEWRIEGSKPFVVAGAGANGYLVSARHEGQTGDAQGWDFFLVPEDAPGLSSEIWPMADGSKAVSLTLDGVAVSNEMRLADGAARLAKVAPLASLARSAEMLGIMERLMADTLDYLRTREQFGQAIGSFQAIQHRMVEQYAALVQGRALLELALIADDETFTEAADGARAFIAEAALALGHEAVQLHGGMGVTDELAIAWGHKRLLVLSRWPDDATSALDRFADAAALPAAA